MAIITVSNANQLNAAISSAKAGDTIQLAGGQYGDVSIYGKAFSSELTIKSLDAGNPATFHSITVKGSAGLNFESLNIDYVPTTSTVSFSSAVVIEKSSDITFSGGSIKGGAAITGVAMDATAGDSTGNVIGLPTGRGITIDGSSNVTVEGMDISSLHRGIVLNNAEQVTIQGNDIHDLRGSGIVGGATQLTIDNNDFSSTKPWHWGQAGGDHADFIALWATNANAATDIKITNNTMTQGDGAPVLGMWLNGGTGGYSNVVISYNAILGGDYQGIMLSNVSGGTIDHNTMLQTNGNYASPSILLLTGAKNVAVDDNIVWQITDRNAGSTGNVIGDNQMVQHSNAGNPGFYDSVLLGKVIGLEDALAIYKLAAGLGSEVVAEPPTPPVTAPVEPVAPVQPPVTTPEAPDKGEVVPSEPALPTTPGATIVGSSNIDKLVGGIGDDTLEGRGGADILTGGKGNDVYIVPNGMAKIVEQAGEGIDTVIAKGDHTLAANVENLKISTEAGNGWAGIGNGLNNVINGNAGTNLLNGAAGDDTITGGAGNDVIIGGAGNDVLTGDRGADTFRFLKGDGQDTITDFGFDGRDVIDLSGAYKLGVKAVVQDLGDDLLIKLSSGDSITLVGVDAHHLSATSSGFVYV